MASYGQFCAIARTHEAVGGRWTLLIVRELLCGSRHFNEIRRGVPRISRTMLAERLKALADVGVVRRLCEGSGCSYALTDAGRELEPVLGAMAVWGQRWLPRGDVGEDLDLEPLLVDMARRVRPAAAPMEPVVIRFDMAGQATPRFLLVRRTEAALCVHNPGFAERLRVRGPLAALAGWWRGDFELAEARRAGLVIDGDRSAASAFAGWFERYRFAEVAPALEGARDPIPAS
jgi:DNA-binding HxlR family transcriptional regulator